jgi:hypothetical protein
MSLSLLSMPVLGQQTCSTLRDAFQDNSCCSATMGRQLATPLSTPLPDTMASMAG